MNGEKSDMLNVLLRYMGCMKVKRWIVSERGGRAENSAELVCEGWRELLGPKRKTDFQ